MVDGPEMALLVRCCRYNFTGSEPDQIEVDPVVNLSRFAQLARYHRVQGLAWNGLTSSSLAEAPSLLAGDARAITATNLTIAHECRGLADTFAAAAIPILFLKGFTVGALAYRSPMLKMAWDIDVLIEPDKLDVASELLKSRGFTLRSPLRLPDLERWHGWSKESVWCRSDNVHVELHTRLADNAALIPTLTVSSPSQLVEISTGITLPTLADDELFAYLAIHGASSAWFRLKWISDFAGFLSRFDGPWIERRYRLSRQLGAGRAVGQALLLADRLFGSLSATPQLRVELMADYATRRLVSAAMGMLSRPPVDPTEQLLGTWPIHWSQLLLLPGLKFKLSEARRQFARLAKPRLT